jgi:tRNA A-37 threonylcarbamoyl transferase component Bud32
MQVTEGQILEGKYRVEHVLGTGGMAVVFSALHLQLDERVAIKVLLPEALGSREVVARFAREARAAVKIKSEHVVRVSDVGTLESGAPYMVMEMLRGSDLAALARESGPLDAATAVDYTLQACEALAEAHSLGIIHRDLKPANLFLTHRADGSPCVKVLDFGISKLTSTAASGVDLSMTRTHATMGSPLYMSPEQMEDTRSVDARTDIWAMGTILYELLTGRVPFDADTVPRLCGLILRAEPPRPREYRPDLSEGLERTILKCLEKDRSQRFQNVAELAAALAPYGPALAGQSVHRISRILGTSGVSAPVPANHSPAGAPGHGAQTAPTQLSWGGTLSKARGRALWVLLGAVGAAAVAGAALWWRSQRAAVAGAVRPAASASVAPSAGPLPHPPVASPATAAAAPAPSAPAPSVLPAASIPDASASPHAEAPTPGAARPNRPAAVHPRTTTPRPASTKPASPKQADVSTPAQPPAKPVDQALDPLMGRH